MQKLLKGKIYLILYTKHMYNYCIISIYIFFPFLFKSFENSLILGTTSPVHVNINNTKVASECKKSIIISKRDLINNVPDKEIKRLW